MCPSSATWYCPHREDLAGGGITGEPFRIVILSFFSISIKKMRATAFFLNLSCADYLVLLYL